MSTYYVNQSGSGTADGSSLGNAASVATLNSHSSSPGDLIILNGTITSTITVHDSGSAGNVITYQYASGAKSSVAFWGTTTAAAIYATGKNYVTIDGNNTGIIECTANGDALANQQQSHGIYTTTCDHFTVQNLTIRNIFVHTSGTANPAGVSAYTTVCWKAEDCSNLDFHGCAAHDAYDAIYWPKTLSGTKSGFNAYSNTVSACSTPFVIAAAAGVIDLANVYSNDITMGANWYEVANNNHIDGIHMWGIGGAMTNTSIHANYVHGDPSTHSTGHIFYEGNMGTVLVYNNLLIAAVNHVTEGLINSAYNGAGNTSRIYNNTLVGLGSSNTGGIGIAIDPGNAAMTTFINNNIIKNCFVGIYNPANVGTLTSNNNDFFGNGNVGFLASGSATLAAWRTASGGDANSISTDPALDGSYNISNTSPCYNTGADLSAYLNTDRIGTNRPQGASFDIGSMEVIVSSTPTLSAASINSAGTGLTLNLSESCTTGSGGNGGITISPSGGAAIATYSSGSGSTSYIYTLSRAVRIGETVTVSYVQPGNGIEATSGSNDLATFSNTSVTNNSIVTIGGGCTRGGKFVMGGKHKIM